MFINGVYVDLTRLRGRATGDITYICMDNGIQYRIDLNNKTYIPWYNSITGEFYNNTKEYKG